MLSPPAKPLLRSHHDPFLQNRLEGIIDELALRPAVDEKRLSLAIAEISNIQRPRVAGVNEDVMMYAASLPKLAILLGLFKKLEDNSLTWDEPTATLAQEMIQRSSNEAATKLFYTVGPEYIGKLLKSPRYNLYNAKQGGGLWVGKEYGKGEAWQREPLLNLSHAASASAVVQFYYLLEAGKFLSPVWTDRMRNVLAHSELDNKLLKGYDQCCPSNRLLRKSGSWRTFHSDSALVYDGKRRYIVAVLTNDPDGEVWIEQLPSKLSRLIKEVKVTTEYLEQK